MITIEIILYNRHVHESVTTAISIYVLNYSRMDLELVFCSYTSIPIFLKKKTLKEFSLLPTLFKLVGRFTLDMYVGEVGKRFEFF